MNKYIILFASMVIFICGPVVSAEQNLFSSSGEEWEGEMGDLQFVDPRSEATNWLRLINQFGGKLQDPNRYPQSPEGFVNFMRDSGVVKADPLKIITPPSPNIAKKCGIVYLLPPRAKWSQGAAIALWAEAISQVAQEMPNILNWYRTPCYNKAVGGASGSDHIQARSADLDFVSAESRRRAQKWLCTYWNSSLNMQIGLGGSVIHLGSQSPRGKRNWYYATYRDGDKGKTCFD